MERQNDEFYRKKWNKFKRDAVNISNMFNWSPIKETEQCRIVFQDITFDKF